MGIKVPNRQQTCGFPLTDNKLRGLVSSAYERPNGERKKSATKITSWSIRADVVRMLDRGEPEPQATASGSDASAQAPEPSDASPFTGARRTCTAKIRLAAPRIQVVPALAARLVFPYVLTNSRSA